MQNTGLMNQCLMLRFVVNNNQKISLDSSQNMFLHHIFVTVNKKLHIQRLLDKLEKNLPSVQVKCGNWQRGHSGIVTKRHKRVDRYKILEKNKTQLFGIVLGNVKH